MSAIADLLADCRSHLDRVAPRDLAAEVAAGALVVDIRPYEQRRRDGDLPGAVAAAANEPLGLDALIQRDRLEAAADSLRERGGVREAIVLLNEQATRANVEGQFQELARRTRPGDAVVLYWSGRGGRLPPAGGGDPRRGGAAIVVGAP